MSALEAAVPVVWNNLKIEYTGPLLLDYDLDSKDRNAKIRITNIGDQPIQNIHFQMAVQGLADYPRVSGDGGFAVFPNGGNIDLAPGESYIAQTWLQGIYEDRFGNKPPVAGESKTYVIDFILATDNAAFHRPDPTSDPLLAGKLTQSISFTRNDFGINAFKTTSSSAIEGGQTLAGTIAGQTGQAPGLTVEIATPYSRWYPVELVFSGSQASFATRVPERDDWLVRITADNVESQTLSASQLATAGIILIEPSPAIDYGYHVADAANAPTGFWRGAVSESEKTFVLIPGQENWSDPGDDVADAALRATSVIRKYSFSGELLWEFAPGWETWGGDMTADGSRVVFLVNPDISRFAAGSWTLGVLDGGNGQLLWKVTGDVPYLEGLEAAISDDGSYVAAGSSQGALGIHDAKTGALIWQKPSGTFGQVRKLQFVDEFLYVGSGDGFLVKLEAATGNPLWKAFVGGWPFVNGLAVHEQAGLIAVGTKSKDTSVIDAQTGAVLWSRQTGSLDAVISPDGKYVANFYGDIFDARTGKLLGQTGMAATALFSPDSRYLIQADRGLVVIADLSGKIVSRSIDKTDTEIGGGEQAQWSYLSQDGATLLVASRDMDTPGERALTIWTRGLPVSPGQEGGNLPPIGPMLPTPGNDVFFARPGNDIVDGGDGLDTIQYAHPATNFTLRQISPGQWDVESADAMGGHDQLRNIERIRYSDMGVAVDLSGHAGQVAKILGAVFGASAVSNKTYVGIGLDLLDNGTSYETLMGMALEVALGAGFSHGQAVDLLYANVVGVNPSAEERALYVGLLDRQEYSPASLGVMAADTDLNQINIDLVGISQVGLGYLPVA